jgi:hypothetical protein
LKDTLLGRKTRWNWGRNSKREIRFLEKRQIELDIFNEIEDEKEDKIREEENRKYQDYLRNYYLNI